MGPDATGRLLSTLLAAASVAVTGLNLYLAGQLIAGVLW
jgi:hypothetical protein